jgi:hypothetical protein
MSLHFNRFTDPPMTASIRSGLIAFETNEPIAKNFKPISSLGGAGAKKRGRDETAITID